MEQAEMIERIRQKAFFKNNGMVLKAVNLLRDKFVALTDIRYALEPSRPRRNSGTASTI